MEQGKGLANPLDGVRHQLALGEDAFVVSDVELAKPDHLTRCFPGTASTGGETADV